MKKENKRFRMVFTGALCGLIFVMSIVPFLGYIPLGFMNATIIQIPVIIGAIMLGTKRGAFLGLMFGLSSLWKNTVSPNVTSFVFSPFVPVPGVSETAADLIVRVGKCLFISVFARVMIGVTASMLSQFLEKRTSLSLHVRNLICGAAGAMTNTVLVMGGIYFLYGEAYAGAKGMDVSLLAKVISGVVLTQGIPEAIVSAVLTAAVVVVLRKISSSER